MKEEYTFDLDKLESTAITQPTYYIGVCDRSYCLCRRIDGVTDILLAKTMNDKKEFELEVENISRYFNARVIKEV